MIPAELAATLTRAGIRVPADRGGGGASGGYFRPLSAQSLWEEPPGSVLPPLPSGLQGRNGASAEPIPELRLPAGATLQNRLKALFAHILEQTGCRRVFVADAEGLVLMEKNSDPVMVALASSFVSLLDRVHSCLDSPTQGSIALDLDQGQVLQLLQADTSLGR